jgi:hypothetical protein
MYLENLKIPALHCLSGYLSAASDFLRTGELKWYFEVRLVRTDARAQEIKTLIQSSYPDAKLETAEITQTSMAGLLETLEHELGQHLPATDRLRIMTPILSLSGAMWDYLNDCIDYEKATIYEYFNREDDELLHGIAGGFAFVLVSESQNRCLFFTASTSD